MTPSKQSFISLERVKSPTFHWWGYSLWLASASLLRARTFSNARLYYELASCLLVQARIRLLQGCRCKLVASLFGHCTLARTSLLRARIFSNTCLYYELASCLLVQACIRHLQGRRCNLVASLFGHCTLARASLLRARIFQIRACISSY